MRGDPRVEGEGLGLSADEEAAFSASVMPSLMKAFFHVSRLVMSGTLSERTLTWQTTPGWGAVFVSWAWATIRGAQRATASMRRTADMG